MQSENIYKNLIDRVLSKINGKSDEPNIKIKALSSFANNVYKVEVVSDENALLNDKIFLLKLYREYLVQFSNKQVQNEAVSLLSGAGQHQHVYYYDNGCRIQDFVKGYAPGVDNITEDQMLKIMTRLGHLVKLFSNYFQNKPLHFQNQRKIHQMFTTFEKVAQQCKQLFPDSYEICKSYVQQILNPKIRQNLYNLVPKSLVPTHNDCHFHNVIISNADQTLYLIDYEFFSLNYRGFELGNFFNQYATDYVTFQIKQELQLDQKTKDLLTQKYYSEIQSHLTLQQAKKEIEIGRLLSHLFWLFIGVKQVKDPKITIDMQYYIKRRFEQFMKIYKKLTEQKSQN